MQEMLAESRGEKPPLPSAAEWKPVATVPLTRAENIWLNLRLALTLVGIITAIVVINSRGCSPSSHEQDTPVFPY